MKIWLIIVGAVGAIVGGIIMSVAGKRRDYAQDVSDFADVFGGHKPGYYGTSSAVESAVALGHFGLGLLVFSALLTLVGVAAFAMRAKS